MAKTKEQVLKESTAVAKTAAESIGGTFKGGVFQPGEIPTLAGSQDVLDALSSKLLGQDGVVTSETTEIDKLIEESVVTTEKRETGIRAGTERARIEAREVGERGLTRQLEQRRGFATNMSLVREIKQETEESLRDLDLREQEALSLGAVEDADSIRKLKIKQLEFSQQAKQQAFSNLLSAANLFISQQQQDRISEQFEFQKKQAISDIALEFGLEVEDGETLESIIKKAKPLASRRARLELEKLEKEIRGIDDDQFDFTGSDKDFIKALGIDTFPKETQNKIINLLTPNEARTFVRFFDEEQEEAQQSLDPVAELEDFIKAMEIAKGSKGNNIEKLKEQQGLEDF